MSAISRGSVRRTVPQPASLTFDGCLRALLAAVLLTLCAGCGDGEPSPVVPPTPVPTPDPGSQVIPGASTGPTQISFVSSEPVPGATLTGCGPQIAGCEGRLRMSFRLLSPSGGHVLRMNAYLHSDRKIACLLAATGEFDLPSGTPLVVEVVYDQSDACVTPVTLLNMDVVMTGTTNVDGRQEWGVRYSFGT